jgi:hypothetical protein
MSGCLRRLGRKERKGREAYSGASCSIFLSQSPDAVKQTETLRVLFEPAGLLHGEQRNVQENRKRISAKVNTGKWKNWGECHSRRDACVDKPVEVGVQLGRAGEEKTNSHWKNKQDVELAGCPGGGGHARENEETNERAGGKG